jgi:hypothetical protein
MKPILKILFIALAFGFTSQAFAQGDGETKQKIKHRTEQSGTVTENDPTRPQRFEPVPGGFTVIKYKESKVKKKLRKGEAHSRFSVPDPKGKPLKHKKKHKFLFFG